MTRLNDKTAVLSMENIRKVCDTINIRHDKNTQPNKPKTTNFIRVLAFGDRHYPHNVGTIDNIIIEIIKELDPHIIIDGGDPIDAVQISTFPKQHDELVGLQDELDGDYAWRERINEASPNSRKILLEDNHFTRRFERLRAEHFWMTGVKLGSQRELFQLDKLGWELLPYWDWKGKLIFIHGDKGRGRNGSARLPINSVRTTVKNFGVSVVRFHTHGTGFEVHRHYDNDVIYAIQLGCLEDPSKANYLEHGSLSNWTHSIGIFYLSPLPPYHVFFSPCIIVDNMTVFNGKPIFG